MPRRREHRVALVGLIVISLLLFARHGVPRYAEWRASAREASWLAASRLAEVHEAIRTAGTAAEALAAARQRFAALAPHLLDGGSSGSAGSSLLGIVAAAAARPGLTLGPLQTTSDTTGGRHFLRVGVRGSLTGDVQAVTEFLRAVESGSPRLTVRELDISQGEPAAPRAQPEALRVHFLIQGITLRGSER